MRTVVVCGVGVVALLVFLTLGSRLVPKEPEATPTPTTRPTATALNPDTFHATLTARPGDPSLTVGTMATVSAAFKNTGTATWAKGTPSEVRLGIRAIHQDQIVPLAGTENAGSPFSLPMGNGSGSSGRAS